MPLMNTFHSRRALNVRSDAHVGGTVLPNPGDHICAMYGIHSGLAGTVGAFLAALKAQHVDMREAEERGALTILSSNAAYTVRVNPEETMAVFSNAIEQALSDGFSGFRAAANMSWALDVDGGPERLITYEPLLRSLFSTARATRSTIPGSVDSSGRPHGSDVKT